MLMTRRRLLSCHEKATSPCDTECSTGIDQTISEIAHLIMDTVGFPGKIEFDHSKPDGTPQKLLDVSRINSEGWRAKTKLSDGLKLTYDNFLNSEKSRN